MTPRPLPWHQPIWTRLCKAREADRLPHALLFSGAEGLGKALLAKALTHSLLCQDPVDGDAPCGQCKACRLLETGNHPDLHQLNPQPERFEISIDDARPIQHQSHLSTQMGGYKVILITPAELLSSNAADALLKTLEEPVPNTLMILIATNPAQLSATLRSRCQRFDLVPPTTNTALAWLREQGLGENAETLLHLALGAPLLALEMNQPELLKNYQLAFEQFGGVIEGSSDPVVVAEAWYKPEPELRLRWMSGWVVDMLGTKLGESRRPINPAQLPRLRSLAAGLSARELFALQDQIQQTRRLLARGTLNVQLACEDLLLRLSQSRVTPPRGPRPSSGTGAAIPGR